LVSDVLGFEEGPHVFDPACAEAIKHVLGERYAATTHVDAEKLYPGGHQACGGE
jgi:hypothetical protein